MNNNYVKTLALIIAGILIGYFVVFLNLGGLRDDIENLWNTVISQSVDTNDLKVIISLHSLCEGGDYVACNKLSEIIKNDKEVNEMRALPAGQIRIP